MNNTEDAKLLASGCCSTTSWIWTRRQSVKTSDFERFCSICRLCCWSLSPPALLHSFPLCMKSCILRICRCPSHCIDVLRVCSGLSPSCHQKAFCWMFLYVVIVSLHQSSPRWGTSLFLFSCYLTAILGRSLPMFSIWTNGNFVFEKLERLFCYLWEPWFWFLTHRKGELVRLARVLIVEEPHTVIDLPKISMQPNGWASSMRTRYKLIEKHLGL